MNTEQKGQLACMKLDQKCLTKGMLFLVPGFECRYDRVLVQDDKFIRVQVKYCDYKKNGAYHVNLASSRNGVTKKGGYKSSEVDALIVYVPETDALYMFPVLAFEGKQRIAIRVEETKNGQTKGVFMGHDYIWECSSVG